MDGPDHHLGWFAECARPTGGDYVCRELSTAANVCRDQPPPPAEQRMVVAAERIHQRREGAHFEDHVELLPSRRLRPIKLAEFFLHSVFQDSVRYQPVRPQRNIAVGPPTSTDR